METVLALHNPGHADHRFRWDAVHFSDQIGIGGRHRSDLVDGMVGILRQNRSRRKRGDAGVILVPSGPTSLVGRWPFHDDHAPSLWLYPDSGLWGCNRPYSDQILWPITCRGAGVHDVINFRALTKRISNRAAIRQLLDEFL